MSTVKVSTYPTKEQKQQLDKNALEQNLPLSQYLVKSGLREPINSSKLKSEVSRCACRLYALADLIEDMTVRGQAKHIAGEIYGALKD